MTIEFASGSRFFIGSDHPHAEGFMSPIAKTRERLHTIPKNPIQQVLCDNGKAFYGV